MLTRLKVDGFKNLDGVDVRLGSRASLDRAAPVSRISSTRSFSSRPWRTSRSLKLRYPCAAAIPIGDRMKFVAELVIPKEGEDELGQTATASMTFLQYELELRYRPDRTIKSMGALELVSECMAHIKGSEAKAASDFLIKKLGGTRRSMENGEAIVSLHADSFKGLGGGRPRRVPAADMPGTMLSSVNNAAEHRPSLVPCVHDEALLLA